MPVKANNMKWCPDCEANVLFHESAIIQGDTCVRCGAFVETYRFDVIEGGSTGVEMKGNVLVSKNLITGKEYRSPDAPDIKEVHIIPARELYSQNRNTSLWFIESLYEEYNFVHSSTKNFELRAQAWQYVKAMTKLLKERNAWKGDMGWWTINPGTQEWLEHWRAHPEDQEDMGRFSKKVRADNEAQLALNRGVPIDDVLAGRFEHEGLL